MDATATATATASTTVEPGADPVATATAAGPAVEVVEQDLLVEDVSIDGMCGVY